MQGQDDVFPPLTVLQHLLFESVQIQVDSDQKYEEKFSMLFQTPLRLPSIDSFSAA